MDKTASDIAAQVVSLIKVFVKHLRTNDETEARLSLNLEAASNLITISDNLGNIAKKEGKTNKTALIRELTFSEMNGVKQYIQILTDNVDILKSDNILNKDKQTKNKLAAIKKDRDVIIDFLEKANARMEKLCRELAAEIDSEVTSTSSTRPAGRAEGSFGTAPAANDAKMNPVERMEKLREEFEERVRKHDKESEEKILGV